ncbi:hypothetical protein V6C53_15940 [Desulfocurvibacter africanus]|uniref:hypothetical protein n=1 Tax=Desulfocurvibacter africanus TaxID=873 RepID=UPI002FDA077C
MKISFLLAPLAALAILALLPAAAVAGDKLLAPVYPGAVAAGVPTDPEQFPSGSRYSNEAGSPFARVFLSKDPIEKVRAFYEQKLGAMDNTFFTGKTWEGEWPFAYSKILVMADKRFDMSTGMGGEVPAGLEISALDPAELRAGEDLYWPSVGPFFERLQGMTVTGGLSRSEYEGLIKKYGCLGARHYAVGKQADEGGNLMLVDEAIFKAVENKMSAPIAAAPSAVEFQAKAQRLMAEGKYDEFTKLNEQYMASMAAMQQNSTGPEGAKLLKDGLTELERNAYRTLIVIHLHPSQWDPIFKKLQ